MQIERAFVGYFLAGLFSVTHNLGLRLRNFQLGPGCCYMEPHREDGGCWTLSQDERRSRWKYGQHTGHLYWYLYGNWFFLTRWIYIAYFLVATYLRGEGFWFTLRGCWSTWGQQRVHGDTGGRWLLYERPLRTNPQTDPVSAAFESDTPGVILRS